MLKAGIKDVWIVGRSYKARKLSVSVGNRTKDLLGLQLKEVGKLRETERENIPLKN